MLSDIEIAQAASPKPMAEIAAKLGLSANQIATYGQHKAKFNQAVIDDLATQTQQGKLILVTAISPTPAGEGKTTTTIGLADALNLIGKKAVVCIREPSLGPVFGLKGGATGGGYAQVVPMEDINLHLTGDFHAITAANNLLAALIDNHLYQGNHLQIDPASITWRRCIDMNDRALRHITLHDSKLAPRDTGFDITVASEVMAIFCLATSLDDLKLKLSNIQVATSTTGKPILAEDLQAAGAMTALLKEAFQPNLVQTLEHTPTIVHGGPFANIAHGCNSVVATQTALKLADYVVTEAGFGADLGAEKFINIKCRQTGLQPALVVLVATLRALKYHGGVALADLNQENLNALTLGVANIAKHINNLKTHFGLQVIVAINHFVSDTPAEIALLTSEVEKLGAKVVLAKHWAHGGEGARALAEAVSSVADGAAHHHTQFKLLYDDTTPLADKLRIIAQHIYGANDVEFSAEASAQLEKLNGDYQHFPVCIAKTQYSFSTDASLRGAPTDHVLHVRELRLSRGAGFIVAICGAIMTMPGLPERPASEKINVSKQGKITGLS